MDFERFTEKTRGFLQKAQTLAMRSSHQSLEPEHMLRVMLEDEDGLVKKLLRVAEGDIDKIELAVDAALARIPRVEGPGAGGLRISTDLAKILDNALNLAEKAGDKFVTGERILQAMVMAKATNVQ